MRIIKYFFILFFFLSKVLIGYSQETEASIDIIHFNSSATYAPGSGVSVHIDPKGVYKLSDLNSDGVISSFEIESPNNNSFILELTDTNGNVIQQLSEVYDFYTPLINGDLPLNLSPGDYQLRVRATHAKMFTIIYDESGNIESFDEQEDTEEVS